MGVLDKFLDAIKLNDDYDDDEFYDEDFDDDDFEAEEKPRKKFFEKFKRDDSREDDFLEEEPEPAPARAAKHTAPKPAPKAPRQQPASSKITPMRSSRRGTAAPNMEVCVIKPSTMEDAMEIADTLLDNSTVVLNLEGLEMDVAQRIIDFTCGTCYSLNGSLKEISSYIFILTPSNVGISGAFQDILGGDNPPTTPIRSAY